MGNNVRVLTAAAIALAACVVAPPGEAGDVYLSLRGGASLLQDSDMTIEIPGVGQIPAELEFDPGWLAAIAAGYGWDNGFAVEGEFSYRQNGIDQEQLFGMTIPIDGFARSYALMANGYYRVNTGTMVTPYVGAGGWIGIELDQVRDDALEIHVRKAWELASGNKKTVRQRQ